MLGIRSQQYDWRDYEENLWHRYYNRLMLRAVDRGIARASTYVPSTPLFSADDVEDMRRQMSPALGGVGLPEQPAQ